MEEKVLKLLYDIRFAIREIETFSAEFPQTFNEYKKNFLLNNPGYSRNEYNNKRKKIERFSWS